MARSIYQVTFRWVKTAPENDKFNVLMSGLVENWARLNIQTWFVSTSMDPEQLYQKLKPSLQTEDSVVIVKIDPNVRAGWAPKLIWDWLELNGKQTT